MKRVTRVSLTVSVNAEFSLPSWIKLDADREGIDWWIKYHTLYYKKGENSWDEYHLDLSYDGDYKRPEVEVEETEDSESEDESSEEE